MSRTTQKNIYIDRGGGIIYIEFIFTAAILAWFTLKLLMLPWSIGIVLFLIFVCLLDYLFFNVSIWRWIFSSAMSAGWAYFVFFITRHFVGTNINTFIIAILAFLFMLWVHKDEFEFESSATVSLFEYYGRD